MPIDPTLIASLGSSILSGVLDQGQRNKIKELLTSVVNGQAQDYQLGRNQLFGTGNGTPGMFSNLGDLSLTNIQRQLQALYSGENGGLFGETQGNNQQLFNPQNLLQTIFGGQQDPYGQNTPGLQDTLSQFKQLIPGLQQQAGQANGNFANNGRTDQSNNIWENLQALSGGSTAPQQQLNNMGNNIFASNGKGDMTDFFNNLAFQNTNGQDPNLMTGQRAAQGILANQGQTGDTNAGIQASLQKLLNGGNTSALDFLSSQGQNVLGNNGLTPTGAQGENAALQTINQGGSTPTTDALQQKGTELFNQPSLMSPQQAISFARDSAGTQYSRNMEAAIRQAQSRGGGPGSSVANGLQNQSLASYSDQGSQAEAKAIQDALTQQQQLQLAQAKMGGDTALQGGALENNRFGTASSALSNLEGIAANRFGTGGNFITGANQGANQNLATGLGGLENLSGLQSQREMGALGAIPGLTNAATSQANTFGNLALGQGSQDLQRLGLGTSMFNDLLNSQQNGSQGATSLFNSQNNFGLGSGQLANAGTNDISSILSSILGGNFIASSQGLNRTNSYLNGGQQGVGNSQNLMNFAGGQQNASTNAYDDLIKQLFGFTTGAGNEANQTRLASIGTTIPEQNPWGNFINQIGQAIPGMIKKP